tara:strand:- start:408 stop:527 length:120 start_codon:yes stop_codon:yes gene_type:complete
MVSRAFYSDFTSEINDLFLHPEILRRMKSMIDGKEENKT